MSTNNFSIDDDFFNHQVLIGKTIKTITVSQEDDTYKHISIAFADSSCLEFFLNTDDIFYMEEAQND